MASRKYRRDSQGRFAGGSGGTVTTGRAGGFKRGDTNAQQNAAKARRAIQRRRKIKRALTNAAKTGLKTTATTAAGVAIPVAGLGLSVAVKRAGGARSIAGRTGKILR